MNFIAYADGTNDLLKISDLIDLPIKQMYPIITALLAADLIELIEE